MPRRNRQPAFSRSSLLLRTFTIKAIALLKFAIVSMMLEILFAASVIGFSYLFMSWGLVLQLALILAIGSTLILLVLTAYLFSIFNSSTKPSEIETARRISRVLKHKRSTEWNEYQDWLHDIMLGRREMLAMKRPKWQVKLVTYKRLNIFCLVVSISKFKQAIANIRRSR